MCDAIDHVGPDPETGPVVVPGTPTPAPFEPVSLPAPGCRGGDIGAIDVEDSVPISQSFPKAIPRAVVVVVLVVVVVVFVFVFVFVFVVSRPKSPSKSSSPGLAPRPGRRSDWLA